MRRWQERSSILAFSFAIVMTTALYGALAAAYSLGLIHYSRSMVSAPAAMAPLQPRRSMAGVSYERRPMETNCDSIPECNPVILANVIELKVAKLGAKEPEPNQYPELQKYEQPEIVEESVNVTSEPTVVKPLPFKEFIRRKAQLDRRKRKKKQDPFKAIVEDDDPRKRATAFERITGRLDGDLWGEGNEQDKRDSYFARVTYELNKQCDVPSSISLKDLKRQVAEVHIKQMGADGTILSYRIRRRARLQAFTYSAEATVRKFMPEEGGTLTLPVPDDATLKFINRRGVIVEFHGRLFRSQ